MRTIYKYTLQITDTQLVQMPAGAELLYVGIQGGSLQMWALVETDNPLEMRTIHVLGTGNEIPYENLRFTGSVQDGQFVWHVAEAA